MKLYKLTMAMVVSPSTDATGRGATGGTLATGGADGGKEGEGEEDEEVEVEELEVEDIADLRNLLPSKGRRGQLLCEGRSCQGEPSGQEHRGGGIGRGKMRGTNDGVRRKGSGGRLA